MENDPRAEQRKIMLGFGSQQEAYGRPAAVAAQ
jgi:hypothetical protein